VYFGAINWKKQKILTPTTETQALDGTCQTRKIGMVGGGKRRSHRPEGDAYVLTGNRNREGEFKREEKNR